jgi:hypothetical protein
MLNVIVARPRFVPHQFAPTLAFSMIMPRPGALSIVGRLLRSCAAAVITIRNGRRWRALSMPSRQYREALIYAPRQEACWRRGVGAKRMCRCNSVHTADQLWSCRCNGADRSCYTTCRNLLRDLNRLARPAVTCGRCGFFGKPRYRTFWNPKTRLMTAIACSTLERTRDLLRLTAMLRSSTRLPKQQRCIVKFRARLAALRIAAF